MFTDLEHFVMAHRRCGELTSDAGELSNGGYAVRIACSCGAVFERRVTAEMAPNNLVRSGLSALPASRKLILSEAGSTIRTMGRRQAGQRP